MELTRPALGGDPGPLGCRRRLVEDGLRWHGRGCVAVVTGAVGGDVVGGYVA